MQTSLHLLTFCTLVLSIPAFAQAPLTEWSNDTLNLRLNYPSDLIQADSAQAIQDGHLTLLGISGTADPKLAAATRCLHPDLLLQLPAPADARPVTTDPTPDGGTKVTLNQYADATILLAELDVNCLTPEQQANAKDLLADMAELVTRVPGMNSIANPSWYNVGSQKVHMAAAQGHPQAAASQPAAPQQVFTMGLSTSWNNHLLVWFFSSNNTDQLNRITKSTVRFGRAAAAPLYPVTINKIGP